MDVMDIDIYRCDYNFSFSINHELCALKKEKRKITVSKLDAFKMEAKNFITTFCNHLILKSPYCMMYKVLRPKCLKCLMHVKKPFIICFKGLLIATILHCLYLMKPKKNKYLYTVVKENKTYFREFDESVDRLDEFFMRHLSDTVQFKNFMLTVKMVLTSSHGQADVE